jgi:hypothetical protein
VKWLLAPLLLLATFPAVAMPRLSGAVLEFIAKWETGGRRLYEKKYQTPIWPGNSASGVTIGIGYDLGHNSVETILSDWKGHPDRGYLAAMAGFKGKAAGNLAAKRQFIVTPWPLAMRVFEDPSIIRYQRIAERAFGKGMWELKPDTSGMLVDLVYNRGGNMVGERRSEMRHIRDVCIPERDDACVAQQLRVMKRIWRGAPLGKGLIARREDEARFIET